MAFLDNSGDIILDAILTPEGRRRMARGGRGSLITKFAFGDDEIDYSLANLNHASGCAYYFIEIAQTPLLEAFGTDGLQYQLRTGTRTDLLYLPEVQINTKLADSLQEYRGVYYIPTNTETRDRLKTILGDEKYVLQSGQTSRNGIVLQSGMNTADVENTQQMQSALLRNNNEIDSSYTVECDRRFIGSVMQQAADSVVRNKSDGSSDINFGSLRSVPPSSQSTSSPTYNAFTVKGVNSQIYYNANIDYKTYVQGNGGPIGTMSKIGFVVDNTLTTKTSGATPKKFTNFGTTATALFSAEGYSDKFDYIDTNVWIRGDVTGQHASVVLRIIRGDTLS